MDNFLFLGLPKSGKTTYFALMAQHLQNVANRTSHMKFLYLPMEVINRETNSVSWDDITSDFIDDCISRIKKQRWPVKTEGYEWGYTFELDVAFTLFGVPIFPNLIYRKVIISYHDYPGEAFEAAFGIDSTTDVEPAPEMIAIAEDMKKQISSAKGLFLILDAEAMFNGQETKMRKKTLTGLLRYIKQNRPNLKLAIIFNKLELFYGDTPDFVTMLQRRYSNAYAHLTSNYKFFEVYPLGEVETDEDGATRPPKTLKTQNILDPVRWMIGF